MTKEIDQSPAKPSILSRRNVLKAVGAGVVGGALYHGLDTLKLLPSVGNKLPDPQAGAMTYRVNPRNGDRISLLGFGCMRYPMLPDALSPTGPGVDEAMAVRLAEYAYEHGVNYFDTAWPYHQGVSEVVLGKSLKRYPRESFFIADKMPTYLNPTREQAEGIFFQQLERCQVEYFDYYLLHALRDLEDYQQVYEKNGVLDFLLEQKAAGRIRNLGWSFHGDRAMLEYVLSRNVDWDFAQVQLNYHDILHEYQPTAARQQLSRFTEPVQTRWVLEQLTKADLPLFVMEPLLGGRLARLNKKALAILQEERPDASAASWAFRYVADLPNVICVLSGMTYMEHLQDNLRTYAPLETLSSAEHAALRRALDVFITQDNIPCTACGYCMPCPYGVNIPGIFTHYNHCVDDEYVPKGVRDADYERARRAYLVGYDRSISDMRQASRCTGCNICTRHCPQGIAIPEQMTRLGKFVEQLRSRSEA